MIKKLIKFDNLIFKWNFDQILPIKMKIKMVKFDHKIIKWNFDQISTIFE